MMSPNMFILLSLLLSSLAIVSSDSDPNQGDFSFNGYLDMGGTAELESNGLFKLTNTSSQQAGNIFYKFPVKIKDSEKGSAFSFSTNFIFAIVLGIEGYSGHGMTFVISPTKGLPYALPSQYLGLFNLTSNGDPRNHIVAVEFDTVFSNEFNDINDNHVGIDINSLNSEIALPAGYFRDDGTFTNLSLVRRKPLQVWIEYNSQETQINVTLYPPGVTRPKLPLLSLKRDLSSYLKEFMYVGFTSSTGTLVSSHYILGWTFKVNGTADDIDLSRLPKIPDDPLQSKGLRNLTKILAISLSLSGVTFLIVLILGLWFFLKRKKFLEILEDWEVQYGPHRFAYKDLFIATNGFKAKELLGKGGFGKVFRGILPLSNIQVAVKKISHDSRQGMREFVAEIATIGRLRHPNLVRLLGYCRRKGELYLVYDFMPNGSLDKFIYQQPRQNLDWGQRFKIIKDVASALFYLHHQWVQVIIHRDIKPANVLVDEHLNGKLGDFGLAKLCDHGIDPQTSHVAGTIGYISPELARTGKSSTSSDVFAFGVLMLEVACGRRPIEPRASPEEMVLVDWVFGCWEIDDLLETVDRNLGIDYPREQVELILKLGLFCAHPVAAARPNMSSVIQFLDGSTQLPVNLMDIVRARENQLVDVSASDCSVSPLTFTESFTSLGR